MARARNKVTKLAPQAKPEGASVSFLPMEAVLLKHWTKHVDSLIMILLSLFYSLFSGMVWPSDSEGQKEIASDY